VVEALAADLVNGWIDGWGATGHDRRIAAVANVASAGVMLEALANRLRIDAYNLDAEFAKGQMDEVIRIVRGLETLSTEDVTIPPEALMQARRALLAAMLVTRDPYVPDALYAVQTTLPGSTELSPLPGDDKALGWAIEALHHAIDATAWITDERLLNEINRIASSEEVPYLDNPSEPTLGTATLTWSHPTMRKSGSPLEDLAGYRIYYGKDENNLTRVLDIGDGEQTKLLVENLDSGTWYFAVTAFCSKGIESEKSNIGSKIIR